MAPRTWPLLTDSSLCHETQVDRDLGVCPLPQTSPDLAPAPPPSRGAPATLLSSPKGQGKQLQ